MKIMSIQLIPTARLITCKDKKPKDTIIAEKFNTYQFTAYKEQAIDLPCRVCTMSAETMKVIKEMPG